ncbi:MAG: tRNA 2-thiouridine(34) synthase MnmA [Nitrospirae bacterium]|nr:MAG: tRNA 2-thiouridine(34) synthase MnmA [Nitrospirota bacterium]
MKSVVVGMSGGVDSAVAAALLVEQGWLVQGVTLQTWETEDDETTSKKWQERGCCKIGIARYVAERLSIPHRVIDIRGHFRAAVVQDFIQGYLSGLTPNPCVRCNERVKFGCLVDAAREMGADYVATGHYAQVLPDETGRLHLHKGGMPRKDQSYFLYRLNRGWLPGILFPVGGMHKDEVWSRAEAIGLPADEVKESQEICFVTKGDYRGFLEEEAPQAAQPGAFVGTDGTVMGTHRGVPFYTPGQRRGLGIAADRRLYVVRVDAPSNTVVVGREEDLQESACTVGDLNLLGLDHIEEPVRAQVKVRYATPAVPATIRPIEEGRLRIQFDSPQRALSPGQSAVFYQGERVLGGGIIEAVAGRG